MTGGSGCRKGGIPNERIFWRLPCGHIGGELAFEAGILAPALLVYRRSLEIEPAERPAFAEVRANAQVRCTICGAQRRWHYGNAKGAIPHLRDQLDAWDRVLKTRARQSSYRLVRGGGRPKDSASEGHQGWRVAALFTTVRLLTKSALGLVITRSDSLAALTVLQAEQQSPGPEWLQMIANMAREAPLPEAWQWVLAEIEDKITGWVRRITG